MELSELTTDESINPTPHQVFLPGCFVVLQGISGDGLPNTIEYCPLFHQEVDEEQENDSDFDEEKDDELQQLSSHQEISPSLEEDHFGARAHRNTENLAESPYAATGDTNANVAATQQASTLPTAGTTTATATAISDLPPALLSSMRVSGNLVLSRLANSQQTFLLNNPTLMARAGIDPSFLERGPVAATAQPNTAQFMSRQEVSSDHTPLPSRSPPEDSFVVVASEATDTPTRIHMYDNDHPNNSFHNNTNNNVNNGNNNNNPRQLRRKHRAIRQWNHDIRERQKFQRKEWLLQQRQHHHQPQQQNTASASSHTTHSTISDDDWYLDSETGQLAIFEDLPQWSSHNTHVLTGNRLGKLSPGSTIISKQLYTLDSETFKVIQVDDEDSRHPAPPSIGCLQILQIQMPLKSHASSTSMSSSPDLIAPAAISGRTSSGQPKQTPPSTERDSHHQEPEPSSSSSSQNTTTTVGYCVYSVHGYAFLCPGIPTLYMDPRVWWWRVTCRVGAFVRQGLELASDHICTIPYGSFVQVTRKTVNRMGLSRLRVKAICDGQAVEGWCSEFLNPLSGQRGHVIQPLPFPVPALYRVTLPEGAVIREQVELSSRQIGLAPFGTLLTIVERKFSEHPEEQCVERLKLAGGPDSGWISCRLNQTPPNDRCVVELVRVDPKFDPHHPAEFHWQVWQAERVRQQEQAALDSTRDNGRMNDSDYDDNNDARRRNAGGGDISSIEDGSGDSRPPVSSRGPTTHGQLSKHKGKRQQPETCLICLTEERNATIVHGETGHIACCLVCARILKARGDRCPVCRLEIDSVIQHFWA